MNAAICTAQAAACEKKYRRCGLTRAWPLVCLTALQACGGGGGSDTGGNDAGFEELPPPPPPAPSAGVLELDSAAYQVDESTQAVTFTVTRTGGSAGSVSVAISTSDGTAVAGEDYGSMTTTATFADGDTGPKSGSVTIFDDRDHEPDETLTLTLSDVAGDADIGDRDSAVVTIVDDDPESFTVGGTIEGLAGDGLVLRNNGDDVPVGASQDSFIFPAPITDGASYDVSVSAQPWSPAQRCEVTNGSGTVDSADITDIIIVCEDVPLQSLLVSRQVGNQSDILKMREDGNEYVVLADSVDNESFAGFAGELVVFRRGTADGGDIYGILPDGSNLTPLATSPQHEEVAAIAGDGSLVVFNRQAGVTAAMDDIYVINADGTGELPLATSPDDEEAAGIAVTDDGERVVYSRTVSGQDDLYSVRLDGTDTIPLATSGDFEIVYAITPGGWVIFQRLTANGYDLYSIKADGTGMVALSTDDAPDEFVTQLEGERLLYRREIESQQAGLPSQYDLFAVNADGTEHVTIADTTLSEHFQGFTPGGRIVFSRELAADRDLFAVDADGTTLATLAASSDYESFLGVLPDDRLVYLRSNPTAGTGDLFLVNPDGSGTFQVTDTPEPENMHHRYHSIDDRLIFSREFGFFDDLFSIRLDGSDERRLTDTPDVDESVQGFTASGGIIYLAANGTDTDLHRIGADGNGAAALGSSVESERLITVW